MSNEKEFHGQKGQTSLLYHEEFNVDIVSKSYASTNSNGVPLYELKNPPLEEDERYKDFDFIAFPFVVLAGLYLQKRKASKIAMKESVENSLCRLFGVRRNRGNRDLVREFLNRESRLFKSNPRYRRTYKPIGEKRLRDAVIRGYHYFIKNGMNPVHAFRKSLRNVVPEDPRFKIGYSNLAHLVWNGTYDSNWYPETKATLEKVFPNHDIQLLCDLFAATSIRASLESNVTKFFKALAQYEANGKHVSHIGVAGNKRELQSRFHGFLDATLVNLDKVARGGRPGRSRGSGRKIYNFSEAMLGNIKAVVVDVWIIRAFNCDSLYPFRGKLVSRSPDDRIYDLIEKYFHELGAFLGMEPRGVCAAVWCSIRWEEGRYSNSTRYDDFVKMRTNHGLFSKQYGPLSGGTGNLQFEDKT